jgi:hypothetical protein
MIPVIQLIHALAVAKNGRSRMTGISFSGLGAGLVSSTMKSTGKKNLSTQMMTSFITPPGFLIDRSTNCKITVVGFSSPRPSC